MYCKPCASHDVSSAHPVCGHKGTSPGNNRGASCLGINLLISCGMYKKRDHADGCAGRLRRPRAGRAHALQHELQQARAVSEERSRDVAQLREVSVQADQALQQCMAQLQVPMQHLIHASVKSSQELAACYCSAVMLATILPNSCAPAWLCSSQSQCRADCASIGLHDSAISKVLAIASEIQRFMYICRPLELMQRPKAGKLKRAAEAQQCLQAEVERLKQAYWAGAGPCKGLTGRQRFLEDQSQGKGGGMYASVSRSPLWYERRADAFCAFSHVITPTSLCVYCEVCANVGQDTKQRKI